MSKTIRTSLLGQTTRRFLHTKSLILVLGLFTFGFGILDAKAQTTLYVDASRPSNGDGLSWATAYKSLGDALTFAHANTAYKTINVAAGTYKPTLKPYASGTPITTSDARDVTFHLPNGVALYGGFPNGGGTRNVAANPTILSGDIDATPDVVTGSGSTLSITGNTENAYHVVLSLSDANTTVLDGFTVIGGNANGSSSITVESLSVTKNLGGGMYNISSSPTVTNTTFIGNSASLGGGMYSNDSSPTITNTTFIRNSAPTGGGLRNFSSSSPTITNTTFIGNRADTEGGGMGNSTSSNPTITNSTFTGNSAGSGGGIRNITSSDPQVRNSILWGNGTEISNDSSTPTVTYSIVQGGYTGCSNCPPTNGNADPLFVNAADPDGADNIHRTADDGIRLQAGSPALNAGNPGITTPTTDITGATRGAAPFDLGAYEVGCPTLTAQAPAAVVSNQSTCTSCALSGGVIAAPTTACPVGSTLQYSTNGGVDWSATLPTYNQTTAITVLTRCNCNTDNTQSSPTNTVTTVPGVCTPVNPSIIGATTGCGSVTLTATGGTAYTWSGGSSTNTAENTFTVSGTYGVTVTNAVGCTGSTSTIVTVNAVPTAQTVTGTGAYCAGGTGVAVGLSNSETGVMYQLKNGANDEGSPVPGTGSAISFGNQTTPGTYTVVATKTTGGCTATMTGSAVITVNSLPTAYNVTGTGAYCAGGTGVAVGLSNSETGVMYQLKNGANDVGSAVPGTGSAIGFGNQTTAATYTVVATRTANSCTATMTGSAVITINSVPSVYTVQGGGANCAGGTGVLVWLDNSEADVTYQLKNGANDVGSAVPGTGSAISFGNQNTAGTYTVVATKTAGGCTATMTGSATVTIIPIQYITLHVNAAVSGGTGNGSSWANAYSSLSDALAAAHGAGVCSRVTVKVAAGTYKPSKKPFNNGLEMTTTDVRDRTFHLRDGMTLEGGYNGTTGARDINANPTILSGDFNGDDVVTGSGSTLAISNNGENAYHVVLASAPSEGIGVNIDGFRIVGGNANGKLDGSDITVSGNTIFRIFGGGFCIQQGTNALTNNIVEHNSADYGGGLYTQYATNTLSNNVVRHNIGKVSGGIYIYYGTNTLINNVVQGNLGGNYGGGLGIENSTNTLINNTIVGNTAESGGGIYTITSTNTLTNNIFWLNSQGGSTTVAGSDYYNSSSSNTFNNNLLQLPISSYTNAQNNALGANSNNIFATNPNFVNVADPDGADNIFRTTDDGLALQAGSPPINTGTATGGVTTDITGATRIGNPDIGAYEYTACLSPAVYQVTGSGSSCLSAIIGLSNSETGVTYQLKNGTNDVGSALAGTGAAISFGNQTTSGTYTVVATRTSNGCSTTMQGSVTITPNSNPTAYAVTGGGAYCAGGAGREVGLANSELGVTYQLKNGATDVGSPVAGTGAAISFGFQTVATTYTVVATKIIGGCTETMSGSQTVSILSPQNVTLHVNAAVSGGTGDGSSWANAYSSLADALATAHTACSNQILVKVAAGTYKPSKKPFNNGLEMTTADGRDRTFHLREGLTLEGGYNGTTGARDINANPTILSGDFNGDDVVTGSGSTLSISNNGENAYHVLLTSTSNSGGVGVSVDGFRIIGGNATGTSVIRVNNNDIFRTDGGGIQLFGGTNTLSNNILEANSAIYGGANSTATGTTTLSNNIVRRNASSNGGGIYSYLSTITLTNNIVTGNSAETGGGIYFYSGTNTLTNNTFHGNTAQLGGGIYTSAGTNTLRNNILWLNSEGGSTTVAGADYYNNLSDNTAFNNLLQLTSGSYTVANKNDLGINSGNLFATDPQFVDVADLDGTDNIFRTADDGLALQVSSPAINAGTTNGAPSTDIKGATRTGNPDIGAYEYACILPTITLGTITSVSITATSFSIPFTATTGSPNQYSLVASTPTAMPGFSPVTNATLGTSPLSVTIPASAANTYNFNLTLRNSTSGCVSNPVPITLTVNPPTLTISTSSLNPFTACLGTVSAQQSFTVSGSNLAGNITVTAPTGFEVSKTSGSIFGNSVTLNQSSGSVPNTPIYVRMAATATGTPSGNVTVASTEATNKTVAVSGTVNALPTAFTVTGGGNTCPGSTGVAIGLNGSQTGVSYQLKRGGNNVGNPVPGTGSSLNFGNFSTAGTYTVEATNASNCAATMNGSATVDAPNPASAGIAANQTICVGTTPAAISLSALVGSVVKWQRATNANFTNATDISVASATLTGSSIGALSVDTWIRAVIQNGTCPAINTSAVRISILTSFTAEATSNASLICSNQTLRLTATPNQAGLTYNWRGPATFGSTLQSPTRTGLTTAMSGVYSVTITRPACNASGSATVSVVVSPNGAAFAPQMTALTFNNTAPNAQTNTVGVCAGSALTLNITANQYTLTYNWRGPAGAGSGSGFMSAPVNGVTNASAQISAAVAANQQGQYTVTVRNGCNVSNHRVINLQVRNCTSTRLAAAEDERTLGLNINLAPNPVRDYLTASFEGVEGQTIQIQLIDAQGRSLQQVAIEAAEGKAQHRFDLRSLPAGMYLLQAETETQRAVKKVIKL